MIMHGWLVFLGGDSVMVWWVVMVLGGDSMLVLL